MTNLSFKGCSQERGPLARFKARSLLAVCFVSLIGIGDCFGQYPGGNSGVETGSISAPSEASDQGIGASNNPGSSEGTNSSEQSSEQNNDSASEDVKIGTKKAPSFHNADQPRRLFVEELKILFAKQIYIERESGLPASWSRTGDYIKALNGEALRIEDLAESANRRHISNMGRDLQVVEKLVDEQIDNLTHAISGSNSVSKSAATSTRAPGTLDGLRKRLTYLKARVELAEFAEKSLQAMGLKLDNY
jgi:hypothetical protein